jgi:DNA (cytosine-5)-methyltransferase 1
MTGLVLSLFPGIGLLDRAFELEGFCVVRGPDLLWGGDVRSFHPPAGRFEGVIGGPPCQAHSQLVHLVRHNGFKVAADLIPEFARCVLEARPRWFLMENVRRAPSPVVPGYRSTVSLVRDVWVGGDTRRLRKFTFGLEESIERAVDGFTVEQLALHRPDPRPSVLAQGGRWVPVTIGGSGKPKKFGKRKGRIYRDTSTRYFNEAKVAQGLPADFELPSFTVAAKIRAIGEGVPLSLGRAVARAVQAIVS